MNFLIFNVLLLTCIPFLLICDFLSLSSVTNIMLYNNSITMMSNPIITDPLEQFLVVKLNFFGLSNLSIYFIFIFLINILFPFLLWLNFFFFGIVYNMLSSFIYFILNIRDIIYTYYGVSDFFFFWFFSLILGLLMFNLSGLLPFSFTLTTHLAVSFGISFIFFVWINVIFIFRFMSSYLALFLPSGTPFVILLLIIPIEIISYFARMLSLSIRLFANMMAGHTLLAILISFLFTNLLFNIIILLPYFVLHLIYFMECGVAILQVYVFTVLSYIYLNDTTYYPGH